LRFRLGRIIHDDLPRGLHEPLDKPFIDDRSTNTRLRAQQSWPVLANTLIGELAALFQDRVGKNDVGDFPPSSSEMRLMSRAASSIMCEPTDVDPVNEIFRRADVSRARRPFRRPSRKALEARRAAGPPWRQVPQP